MRARWCVALRDVSDSDRRRFLVASPGTLDDRGSLDLLAGAMGAPPDVAAIAAKICEQMFGPGVLGVRDDCYAFSPQMQAVGNVIQRLLLDDRNLKKIHYGRPLREQARDVLEGIVERWMPEADSSGVIDGVLASIGDALVASAAFPPKPR
jgi:hypothetical protein